jgi:hypothetical protein
VRALPRLPGRDLATAASSAGEPLTRANFLKGQAVNGPFGVMARLARQLELVDDDGRVGRNATALLIGWAEDRGMPGVLDEDGPATRAGAGWMADAVKATAACIGKREWPSGGHRIWEQLADHLRPDQIRPKERRALLQTLETTVVRRRVLGLLKDQIDIYREVSRTDARGDVERAVLLRAIRPSLGADQVDRLIADVIAAADSYEQAASLFQQAFEGLIWGLKHRGGRAKSDTVLGDDRLKRHLGRTCAALSKAIPRLDQAINLVRNQPSLDTVQFVEPMARLREDVVAASSSERDLAQAVLNRHGRVQRAKSKAQWIDTEAYWTLMPGENRISSDAPPVLKDTYLHPFKIPNAYALLRDLGRVRLEGPNGEE